MTLYLKYRPQKISELDLTNVRESLEIIIKSGDIPHAFLFAGPKGTGKTSAARIIAKVVNCESTSKNLRGLKLVEPCNKCAQCMSITKGENLDVVELDAASHRGIDDVRALRDAVKLAPAKAKKKVYIIDEAHMLTTEASNALLKTLEEPPDHVMFILATTNPEKLIETIRSRTMLIQFQNATVKEMLASLKKKVKGEKVKVDEETLALIAEAADYSFRDADKILEQLITGKKKLVKEQVEQFLFKTAYFDVDRFIDLLVEKDAKKLLELIEKAVGVGGASSVRMTEKVIERLRGALFAKVGIEGEEIEGLSKQEVVELIKLFSSALSEISTAYLEQIPLEIAVVEWCGDGGDGGGDDDGEEKEEREKLESKKVEKKVKNLKDRGGVEMVLNGGVGDCISDGLWAKILAEVRPKNTSTEALLRAARPVGYDGKTLTLGVFYSFHKERLEVHPHRDLLESVSAAVLGNPVRIACKLTQPPEKPTESKDEETSKQDDNSDKTDVVLTESKDEDIIKVAKEVFGN